MKETEILVQARALRAATRDLRAVVEADLARTRERNQRDREHLIPIADVLKHWANGQENK